MKKIKPAFLSALFFLFLYMPETAYSGCLATDNLADSFVDETAKNQYMQMQKSYAVDTCGGGGGGGGGSISTPTCSSRQYLSGSSCLSCSSAMTGCSTCSSSSVCTACSSGYYLSGDKCSSCPSGCSACSSSSACSSCDSGYTLSSGKCIKECGTGCSNCDTSTGRCNTCKTGWFKYGLGQCAACPTGCGSCSSSSSCSSCASGYTLIGDQCYAGQTKCPSGLTLTDGTCCNF